MAEQELMYKIEVYPFTKGEASEIRNYLSAFLKNKTVNVEGIS